MHIIDVMHRDDGMLVVGVESGDDLAGCPDCGVLAVGHGPRVQLLHDAPCFGRPVRVQWRKRICRCPKPTCGRRTWTEEHPNAVPRAKLTARASRGPSTRYGRTTPPCPRSPDTSASRGTPAGRLSRSPRRPDLLSPAGSKHQDDRRGRAHLAPLEDQLNGQGCHRDGRPDPRRARLPARPAAGRRPRAGPGGSTPTG
jgi:hypothetical protein